MRHRKSASTGPLALLVCGLVLSLPSVAMAATSPTGVPAPRSTPPTREDTKQARADLVFLPTRPHPTKTADLVSLPTRPHPAKTPSPQVATINPLTGSSAVDGVLGLYVGTIGNIDYWSPALPSLQRAGFGSIRVFLSWSNVETAPSRYSWSKVDEVLRLAEANGLRVEFVVKSVPPWSQAGAADSDRGPDDPARLTSFLSAVCTRYRGRISALQIWNEPNATKYFAPYPGLTLPESYVRILKAAYVGAKAADPGVKVIGGNMDGRYATDLGSPSYAQDDFTAACYAAGAKGYFDIWATHNYPGSPSTRVPEFKFGSWAGGRSVWSVVDAIRAIMDANGDASKRLAISEVGWLNSGTAASCSETPSLATQRRYTVRHVVLGLAHGIVSYQVMFVKDVPGNCKGIFDASFGQRPVLRALDVLDSALSGCIYTGALPAGTNAYAHRFARSDGRIVVVVWTTRGEYIDQSGRRASGATTAVLPLPDGARFDVLDLEGSVRGTLRSGQALGLSNDPVIVVEQ